MINTPLSQKTVLMTGASGGIGRATARLMARSGANLLLHGHSNAGVLESLVEELQTQHPGATMTTMYADLSLETEQNRLMHMVSNLGVVPDILLLAAGCDLMCAEMKQRSFDERLALIWQVDVVSTMRLARFFGERMKQTRLTHHYQPAADSAATETTPNQAAIVFFGWDGVEYGMASETAQLYAAAKGAVQGFSRSLAKILAPEVRVNCVAPAWIKTTWGETVSTATDERVAAGSLARRWGTADDVAEVVRFLVSQATYVNNQTIYVNGGNDDYGSVSLRPLLKDVNGYDG